MDDHHANRLTDAIDRLTNSLNFTMTLSHIEKRIEVIIQQQISIMSAITDYTTAVNAKFDTIETSISKLSDEVTAIEKALTDIQNSLGTLSPADQKSLDDSLARVGSLSDKLDAVIALAANPPPAPTPTPAPTGGPIPGSSGLNQ